MSSATFYKWRAKYGGLDASRMARLKELEEENRRLKKRYAEERIKAEIVQQALQKKWYSHLASTRWPNTLCSSVPLVSDWLARRWVSVKPATDTRRNGAVRTLRLPVGGFGGLTIRAI